MSKLFFTIGMPRSGKSTDCIKWLKREYNIRWDKWQTEYDFFYRGDFTVNDFPTVNREPRAVVCGDDFRLALHGDVYHWETEGFVGAAVFAAIRALLKTGHDVLFDETNSSEFSIRRILEIDNQAVPIFVTTPLQTCLDRAKANKQEYLYPVIERVDRNIQKLYRENLIEKIRNEYTSS